MFQLQQLSLASQHSSDSETSGLYRLGLAMVDPDLE